MQSEMYYFTIGNVTLEIFKNQKISEQMTTEQF